MGAKYNRMESLITFNLRQIFLDDRNKNNVMRGCSWNIHEREVMDKGF
jgi:hypothetical protein